MSHSLHHRRPRRARALLKAGILLFLMMLIGVLLWQPWGRRDGATWDISRVVVPPRPTAVLPPAEGSDLRAMRAVWLDAMANDGRVLEPGVAVRATGLSARKSLQLALDEVFTLGRDGEPAQAGRIRPRANRGELERFVLDRVASGAPATYPVLYVKDAARVPGNLRIATGEIIAVLRPGVPAAEIARAYGLQARPEGSSKVGLTRLIARNAFRALELVPKLAADPRIAMVDHDLMKPVQPKALVPNDSRFPDQWAIFPVLAPGAGEKDMYNIGLFPTISGALSLLPNAAPVWGDFDNAADGIRGRGVRVGIVDDGLELNHPDLYPNLAQAGDHHAYDMVEQKPQTPGDVPPPRVQGASGLGVEPVKLTAVNRAHGVNVAGIIGAAANNNIGLAGVAPRSTLVGIRAFSYAYINGFLEPPDPTFYRPVLGDLISPTQDVMVAAAMEFASNDFSTTSIPGKKIYRGTFYETDLPTFSDAGAGAAIPVKNMGFGAPDSGVIDGPGPEAGGYYLNGQLVPGARERAVRRGRFGLGTVFVQPAGNGRFNTLENSNNDGYANGFGAITVGALARFRQEPIGGNEDGVNIGSEWGANLTVAAPGGGSFWRKGARAYNQRPLTGGTLVTRDLAPIATADWTINEAARPATPTRPATPALFGLNQGGGTGTPDYQDGAYTKRFTGTSAAAAHVSGVVALMLEANPRLSWMDVQHTLIRTARKHIDPDSYAANPAAANHPPIPDGLDISDPADSVAIDRDWVKNAGNLWWNHKYGAGLVDAGRAVAEAQIGVLLPKQSDMLRLEFTNSTVTKIPDSKQGNNPGTTATLTFNAGVPPNFVITHVQLVIDRVLTSEIGQLFMSLTAPGGMESILLEPRLDFSDDLINWGFSSLRHWGENGSGTWTLNMIDYVYDGNQSTADDAVINQLPQGEVGTATTRLILNGYLRPEIPRISRPASKSAAEPTVVQVTRGRNFSYSMGAANRPTTWLVREPLATENNPGLPPGLRLGTVLPSEETTYLETRLITGRTTAAVGSVYDVEVVAANVGGFSETHYLRFVVVPQPSNDAFTQWGAFHFPPTAVNNPAANGSADPDGDGLINVVEYALGTSPVKPDAGDGTVLVAGETGGRSFRFNRYPTREIVYEVQVSDSLAADSWKTVVRSDWNLAEPEAGADGVPVSLDPNYTVSEGDLVPAGDEPQSGHRPVTVTNNPEKAPPLYYRLKVIPARDPLNPQ